MGTTYYGAGTTEVLNFLGFTSADQSEVGLTDTQITDALQRAQYEIDQRTKTHFASGTSTPDYVSVKDEKHDGQGRNDRTYYTIRYPIASFSSYLAGSTQIGAGTVNLNDATQFPSSGVVGIESDKVAYTGVSGSALTGATGITTVHLAGTVNVLPYVVEISTDDQGANPTWQEMNPDTEYDIDVDAGRVYLFKNNIINSYYTTDNPPPYTPNRVRFNYLYGWAPDTNGNVPVEIKKLTLMIVTRDLMRTIVMKAHMRGFNQFNPSMINVNDEQIEEYIKRFQNPMFGNVH